jgi:hypothetical protein
MASYVDKDEAGGFVDKRRGRGQAASVLATAGNYASDGAMETRLAAANGTYFTAARLNQMTANDKIYALRTIDDAAGIK